MASAVICLSKGQKFNFLKNIFDSLVRNVDSNFKFYVYPRFIQLIIQNQVRDLSTHTTRFISPALTKKVFANMRRVRKGFSGVETPLFEGMLVVVQTAKEEVAEVQVQVDAAVAAAVEENVAEDVAHDAIPSPPPHAIPSPSQEPSSLLNVCSALSKRVENLETDNAAQKLEIGRMIAAMDINEGIELVKDAEGRHAAAEQAVKQAEIYHIDLNHSSKVLSMQEDESKVHEVVEVVTTAKLITNVVTAASQVSAASATISAAKPSIPAAAPIVVATYTRRRNEDKGKGIMVETLKPMKKKDQIELDAEYARKLHEEINKDH
nr:hypothetical protein [Tanacetum cinerariifolium]